MRIIDARLRPPALGFLNLRIMRPEIIQAFADQLCVPPAKAALERSLSMLWQEMDESGVSMGIMSGRQCVGARGSVANDDIAELERRYPSRLVGFGAVRIGASDTLREVERAVKELGLHGICVEPGLNNPVMYASDPAVGEVARKCEQLAVPLMITISSMAGPDLSYSDPVDVDRLAGAFPRLPIIVAYACWPYVHQLCGVGFKRRNVYLMPAMYMLNCPGVSDLVTAANSFLQDRFLFASSYPNAPLKPLVDLYASLPFKDTVRDKIMYENAARLLKL